MTYYPADNQNMNRRYKILLLELLVLFSAALIFAFISASAGLAVISCLMVINFLLLITMVPRQEAYLVGRNRPSGPGYRPEGWSDNNEKI